MTNQSNAVYSKGMLWMPLDCFCNIEEKLAANGIHWLASTPFQVGYIYTAPQKAGPSGYVETMSIYLCSAARVSSKRGGVGFVPRGGQKTTATRQAESRGHGTKQRVSQNDSVNTAVRRVPHTHTCESLSKDFWKDTNNFKNHS